MNVAFLGLGRMGVLLVGHVLSAGHDLVVWNRSPGKAGVLIERGARDASSIAEAVRDVDRVVLMLFGPDSGREVLGAGRRSSAARDAGDRRHDHRAGRRARARGEGSGRRAALRDAPVAGSTGPAADGTLGVLVGELQQDYDDALPLLHLCGGRRRRCAEVGAGSALELCVNQGLGVLAAGLGESLRLGRELGLDRDVLLDVLGTTAYGWYLAQKRPMLESGDFSGTAFSLDLMAKDLALATEAGADLPLTAACLDTARAALPDHAGQDCAAMTSHVAGRWPSSTRSTADHAAGEHRLWCSPGGGRYADLHSRSTRCTRMIGCGGRDAASAVGRPHSRSAPGREDQLWGPWTVSRATSRESSPATASGSNSMCRWRPSSRDTGQPDCSARATSSAYVSPNAR